MVLNKSLGFWPVIFHLIYFLNNELKHFTLFGPSITSLPSCYIAHHNFIPAALPFCYICKHVGLLPPTLETALDSPSAYNPQTSGWAIFITSSEIHSNIIFTGTHGPSLQLQTTTIILHSESLSALLFFPKHSLPLNIVFLKSSNWNESILTSRIILAFCPPRS